MVIIPVTVVTVFMDLAPAVMLGVISRSYSRGSMPGRYRA
jgi:hypothetical protein